MDKWLKFSREINLKAGVQQRQWQSRGQTGPEYLITKGECPCAECGHAAVEDCEEMNCVCCDESCN